MTRTDPHSPGNLVTEDYEYLCSIDRGAPGELGTPPEILNGLLDIHLREPGRSFFDGRGHCHHCGNSYIRYEAWLLHTPTDTVICVGETCLDNRFERATADFHALRKAAELDRQQQRIKKAKAAFVAERPDLSWMIESDWSTAPEAQRNFFVADIARKLNAYGDLSERQVAAVRKAIDRDREREAQRQEDAELWVPIPDAVLDGRIEVTGEILTFKSVDTDFGTTLKVLLKVDAEGGAWKLWTTFPAKAPNELEQGDSITIKVRVSVSRDDQCFGFGNRPTFVKAEVGS